MKFQRITAFFTAILIIICSMNLTSCVRRRPTPEETLEERVEKKILAYSTNMLDSAETLTDNAAIEAYLLSWAASKNVDVSADERGNVIMKAPCGAGFEDLPEVVVIAQYDAEDLPGSTDVVSMGLYIAKNSEDSVAATVIFTPQSAGDMSGIKALDASLIPEDAYVFSITPASLACWSFRSGAYSTYIFSSPLTYKKPSGDRAYRISISGLPASRPDALISTVPNPIKEFSELLGYYKTTATIFELADISSGQGPALYPDSAVMTVVIDHDNEARFLERLDTSIENFRNRYGSDFPDAEFEYEETALPERVFSDESQNGFISAIYTLVNGVFLRDGNDEVVTMSNLGSLRAGDTKYIISAIGYSLSSYGMSELSETYETICSLSGITYQKTDEHIGWSAAGNDAGSEFALALRKARDDYNKKDLEFADCVQATPAAFLAQGRPDSKIVNVVTDKDHVSEYTGTIIQFMINLAEND